MNRITLVVLMLILSCQILEDPAGKKEKDPTDDLKTLAVIQLAMIPPCKQGLITNYTSWSNFGSPYIGKLTDGTNFCYSSMSSGLGVFATFDYPEPGSYKIQIFNEKEENLRRTIAVVLKQDIETLTSTQFSDYINKLALIPYNYRTPFDTVPPVCIVARGEGQTTVCTDTATAGNLRRSAFITTLVINTNYTLICEGNCPHFIDNKGRIVITKVN
ncbi:hypothetical protein [Leptospira alstonii]|uniref:hypothetical protein n=1 Tax=Leptospira alstonii TaxID=28452 RepID=UPI00077327CE|nr:hypothetical protein [Leptospira alstonii]